RPPAIDPLIVPTGVPNASFACAWRSAVCSSDLNPVVATVPAFAPVRLQACAPASVLVSVSVPDPPLSVAIPLKVVLVFSVPVFAALTTHALVPSVAASVSVPPPPAIDPLNVPTVVASVNRSVHHPPE